MKKTTKLTLDAFRAANTTIRARCSLAEFLSKQSKEDIAVIRQALADSSIQGSAISRVLQARGFTSTSNVVRMHRSNGCRQCDLKPLA